jgi:ADP-heptose:LPS heptosyltransferase
MSRRVALVLRALGLGDLLAGVPALRGVRRALPDHHLVLATDPALQGLVDLVGGIDELLPATDLTPLPVPVGSVDVAIDLHGKGPLSQPVLMALSPRRLVAFECAEIGVSGPRWRPDEHEAARWCRLVTEAFGVVTDPTDLLLPAPDVAPPRVGVTVLHPGAAFQARRWPVDRYAAVAAALVDRGHDVVVTGSAAERDIGLQLAARAGLPSEAVLAGGTTVAELAGLVAAARLVVCGDTGTAHLASAFAVPSVVLFGPVPPAEWGPPRGGPHVALWHGTARTDPWGDTPDAALLTITPAEVLQAIEAVESRAAAGTGRAVSR